MNIVEAYIKFKKQLIIFISGMSGSGITQLAKNIANDFNTSIISYSNYYKKTENKVILTDGTEFINCNSDDTIDWKKLNDDIMNKKKNGVVVYSQSFPLDKLDNNLHVDFHIHIKLSKQNLFNRRKKFIERHPNLYKNEFDLINTENGKIIFNKYIYPYYLETINNTKINKWINANKYYDETNNSYNDKNYDIAFDYLMNVINNWLINYNKNNKNRNIKTIRDNSSSTDDIDDDGYLLEYPKYFLQ